ncbi:MAG: gliding motility-associated C-terminal domain-containing protein, partial [Saprospiraceae bacterium]
IQLLANGGFTPTSYEWDPTRDGLSCYNCPNPFATPTDSTTYVVLVTGEGGCTSVDSVTVNIFDPSSEFAGPDLTICEGESTILNAGSFGSNPAWSPGTGLSCQFCPNPTANPRDTTTYTISVLDDVTGCTLTDTIVINVVPIDAIDAGEDKLTCPGDPVVLDGVGFGTIAWTPASLLDNAAIATPTATIQDTTRFYITATQGLCELRDSVDVSVVTAAEVIAPDVEICFGETAQLSATGLADSYSWTPSDNLSSDVIPDPVATVSETTTYIVTAALGSCDTDTDTLLLTVNELPTAEVYEIYYFYPGEAVQIIVTVPEDANYAFDWIPTEGLNCTDCQNPIATVDSTTTFNALITDLDTGCESEITTQLVRLDVCSSDVLAVPNGFTPNDDGNNDILYVRSTGVSSIGVFRVFNRWGELLFETNSLSEGWDGTHKGKPVNPGVFVYYVEGICPIDGSKLLQKGNVTLIR